MVIYLLDIIALLYFYMLGHKIGLFTPADKWVMYHTEIL
jgi:hypothetical protein